MKLSGADIVLECLTRVGIDTVFGYPGGVVLPLYDRFPAHPEIHHILVRHEQGAGHAADGYARASGRIGCALATSGPGATNLVTAIQNAMMDSVPTLFVTGNVARNMIGKDGFQEADATGITMPCVKHNYLVMRAEDLAYTFAEAVFLATTGRPGPVHIDIPKDVFIEEAEFEWPETVSVRGYELPDAADPASIAEAARLIDAAERPLIIGGHGVILGSACEELRAFAERSGIPVLNHAARSRQHPADACAVVRDDGDARLVRGEHGGLERRSRDRARQPHGRPCDGAFRGLQPHGEADSRRHRPGRATTRTCRPSCRSWAT